ncbi:pentapeptide repeat protein [Calothrix parasitica NIES-267]|uniref:Pentapeptide repeat protein n=1 Tax=Calothrix parasitica NIES-267 TaxID=1973488 RepID=A0A1Z4LWJ8_9CYAN|nr:pentapeptide repeat protein [Calothrix parasitica NIES-267]
MTGQELLQLYAAGRKDFIRIQLEPGTNLSGANLNNANLCDANLAEVDFTGANLQGANLQNTDLSFSKLIKVNFRRVRRLG